MLRLLEKEKVDEYRTDELEKETDELIKQSKVTREEY